MDPGKTDSGNPFLIEGRSGPWEVVIGMEVHAQVLAQSKLFSGSSTAFGAAPNAQVSLVDAAMPGMLPVINRTCVEQAVRTGLGLGAQINPVSTFDRKNYFYPDLPQGYQISQYKQPIVGQGQVVIDKPDGSQRAIGITRLHLEQDAGKSLHDQDPTRSYIDLNRAGCALMEIVSEPDLRSAEEAGLYLTKLRSILRYLKVCDGNMQEGSLRADVNVSVRRPGDALGVRCEIKNLNSIRFVQQAVTYEAQRQIDILEDGGDIVQQTRLFKVDDGRTYAMRSKEEAHDYRYFPDPDLLPLHIPSALIDRLRTELPELPDTKKARFVDEYGLAPKDAELLVNERETADYFEDVARQCDDARVAANWVTGEVFALLNKSGLGINQSPVSAKNLGALIGLIARGDISGRTAKDVFAEMAESGNEPEAIVEAKGLKQVSDEGELMAQIDDILSASPEEVAAYKAGKHRVLGFFVGQVMKATGGRANPQLVNRLLKERLS